MGKPIINNVNAPSNYNPFVIKIEVSDKSILNNVNASCLNFDSS